MAIVNNQKQGNSEMSAFLWDWFCFLRWNGNKLSFAIYGDVSKWVAELQNFAEEKTFMQTAQAAMCHQQQPRSSASKVPLTLFPLNDDQQQQLELANLQQQQLLQTQMGFFARQSPLTVPGCNYLPTMFRNSQPPQTAPRDITSQPCLGTVNPCELLLEINKSQVPTMFGNSQPLQTAPGDNYLLNMFGNSQRLQTTSGDNYIPNMFGNSRDANVGGS